MHHRGFTLIELVTSIVILAIATSGVLLAINATVGRSADPMVQEQASAIAQAYLEEILLKSFCDPDQCTASGCAGRQACAGTCHVFEGAGNRPLWDSVCDYDGLSDGGAEDQTGTTISGLGGYTVSVEVVDAGVDLNGLTADSGGSVLVNVTVSNPAMQPSSITLSGFKANY